MSTPEIIYYINASTLRGIVSRVLNAFDAKNSQSQTIALNFTDIVARGLRTCATDPLPTHLPVEAVRAAAIKQFTDEVTASIMQRVERAAYRIPHND